jgi:uroporphyrinogen-III synthase
MYIHLYKNEIHHNDRYENENLLPFHFFLLSSPSAAAALYNTLL